METTERLPRSDAWVPVAVAAGAVLAVALVFGRNYLMFHTLVEIYAALVALMVFAVAWHTRRISTSDYLTFVGMASLSVGLVTIVHALSYRGMNVFSAGADLPTQLWVIARVLQTSAFLLAPIFLVRRLRRPGAVMLGYLTIAAVPVLLAFADHFPAMFVEGEGLTTLKISAEYAIIAASLIGLTGLWVNREHVSRYVLMLVSLSIAATVLAELAFTLYTDPFGPANRLGHLAHIVALVLVYAALVQASLERPIEALFYRLAAHERELSRAYSIEHEIAETLQNAMTIQPDGVAGVEFGHRYLPGAEAGRIGGDFYDMFRLNDRLVGFVIGDVCGKGLPTGVIALKVRAVIRALAFGDSDPCKVLAAANEFLYRELDPTMFVTAAYGTIDVVTGDVRVSLAGHPEPIVCGRPDAQPPEDMVVPPLGAVSSISPEVWEFGMRWGEILLLVTDGIIEARDAQGTLFGQERLRDLSADCAATTADGVVAAVLDAVERFTQNRHTDDVALIALCFSPE